MKKIYIEPKVKIIEVKSHKMFATSDPTNGFSDKPAENNTEGDAKDDLGFGW